MIEKILEKLEELRSVDICTGITCAECEKICGKGDCAKNYQFLTINKCKEIVQEVAKDFEEIIRNKEYGNASDNDLAVVSALPSLYPLQKFEEEAIHNVVASAKDSEWIPCSERLPSKEEFFKNDGRFIVNDGNRVYQSTYDIYGQCFRTMKMHVFIDMGYRSSFEVDNCVIEWMPLPPYQKGE